MSRFFTLCATVAVFLFITAPASAQSLDNQPDPIQFLVAPEVPAPGDSVLIEVQGVGNFLGQATITWQLNGETMKSGIGERTFSFTLGALGTQTSVRATINSPTKGVITKNFTFLPSLVHLIWEADTSAPPWYRGKSLYSAGSSLTITAFPQIILRGASVSSNNLTFEWRRNNTPLPQQSGKGKNVLRITGNQLLPGESIEVDVFAGDALVGRGSLGIQAQDPQVLLYVRDPLRGVLYDSALANIVELNATEFTIKAEPFYFANNSIKNGTVPFEWRLNNKKTSGPETTEGVLTLRQTGGGAGRASLEVALQNTESDKYVQAARAAVQILFGGATNSPFSNFFGL